MPVNKQDLTFCLSRVEKPARYIGREMNVIRKDPQNKNVRVCLIYPDTYEVGTPFLGFQILYHIINKRDDFLAERCFAPWIDMEALLRENEIPLFSLENHLALKEFNVLGFTLQYEMTYTNILNCLDLGGVPLKTADRDETDPIVFGGGSCSFNPEPLADFIDVFVIGDGEEITLECLDILNECKKKNMSRRNTLEAMNLPHKGVYIPSVYNYEKQGPVKTAKISKLKSEYYATRPLIPLIEVAQDRFALEIQRGCGAGCRFCQAGMIYRPVRERPVDEMEKQAYDTLTQTGYSEMSLLSLSTSDYSDLGNLVDRISPLCEEHNVAISFPSLRLDSFNLEILRAAGSQRRSGLTFAPEAGTQRLRDVINKKISEDDLISSVELALSRKWRTIKFYFMIGLPTEKDEDLQGIVDLIHKVNRIAAEYHRPQINVSLSSFIPKAHTPFQWDEHVPSDELRRRILFVKNQIHGKNIKLMYRDPAFSVYESLLARGDRHIGRVIENAWQNGARFDAWLELFDQKAWDNAIIQNMDKPIEAYIGQRDMSEKLPWYFVDIGVRTDYLKEERLRAEKGLITDDCRTFCGHCGVCGNETEMLIENSEKMLPKNETNNIEARKEQPQNYITLRLSFDKFGMMRYISHQDFMRMFQRITSILDWPVRYSRGFNRRPRILMGYPVPMGFESYGDYMDILLNEHVDNPVDKLNTVLPEGVRITKAEFSEGSQPNIMPLTKKMTYEFELARPIDAKAIKKRISDILSSDSWISTRYHKKREKRIDLIPFISDWSVFPNKLSVTYDIINSQTGRPDEFMKLAFGKTIPYFIGKRINLILDNYLI